MNRIKIRLIPAALSLVMLQGIHCQDQPDVGNYMFFLPLVNPAASGSYNDFSGAVFARKQWFSIDGSPLLCGVHIIQPLGNNSIGASLNQESIGVHSKQKLFGYYTYKINFSKSHHLAFGLGGGGILLKSNYDKVKTTDGADNMFAGSKTVVRPDFNFGIFYFSNNYHLGVSIPSMIHNTIVNNDGELEGYSSLVVNYWQYYLHGGFDLKINKEYTFSAASLTKVALNTPVDFDLNVQLQYLNLFGGGISYRTKSDVIFFGNVKITDMFRLCYCYHSYFNIKGRYLTGHEVILTFNKPKLKPAVIQTPRF